MIKVVNRFSQLGENFYTKVSPTPLKSPHLIHFNKELSSQLNIVENSEELIQVLGGNKLISEEYHPVAALYAGHQFGVWVPQLGDGRAMLIAEHESNDGNIWELQTKGGGITPYSRGADGRAVLRSSIREYLGSHAMSKLNVPTTLALAMVGTNSPVYRETVETAAVVLRVAPSFIRFGSFEVFASRNQTEDLKKLCEFVISNYYPKLLQEKNKFSLFYDAVIQSTANMIAKWQGLGFCHGVMNTDNMSILGLTLDYGPFGFMDRYDPSHICNHSDHSGRYNYANQPYIGWWNLARLGESLLELIPQEEVKEILNHYSEYYTQCYIYEFGKKLGISDFSRKDLWLLEELLIILAKFNVDWTIFWRQFSHGQYYSVSMSDSLNNDESYLQWLVKYNNRRKNLDSEEMRVLMLATNPALVPRNYLLQNAIEKAQDGDFREVDNLFRALNNPFSELEEFRSYQNYTPKDAIHISVSCSS